MTPYQRLFGAGPRGLFISLILLGMAWQLEPAAGLGKIIESASIRMGIFALSFIIAFITGMWGLKSLRPDKRGTELITSGAYQYLRHPLYASLLSCFNFGLAVFLNNWIYLIWAILLHPLWHWNIQSEELLMQTKFPNEYSKYCKSTGRFFPRFRKKAN